MKIHQSGDKIIVTELRPMSEIPEDVYVLVHDGISLYETRAVQGEMKDGTGEFVSDRLGWIQMPQYRPEAKHVDKTELYEKLRKLNPRQFGELFETHLKGDVSFDELVAKLP